MAGYFVRTDKGYVGGVTEDGKPTVGVKDEFASCYQTPIAAAAVGEHVVALGLARTFEVVAG